MKRLHPGFWIGFSAAIGAILTLAVVAAWSGGSSADGAQAASRPFAARGEHVVRPTRGPLAPTLAVFARPRTKADVPPPAVAATLGNLEGQEQVSEALRPGKPDIRSSRLLLDDVGSWHGAIYAAPTDRGNVCYYVTVGPETCPVGFTQDFPVDVTIFDRDEVGGGSPAAVTGLAPDDVTAITVVVAGVGHPARLDNNAYFYELADASVRSPDSLVIHYRDRSVLRMPLPQLSS
jgi:hypothetical protein